MCAVKQFLEHNYQDEQVRKGFSNISLEISISACEQSNIE